MIRAYDVADGRMIPVPDTALYRAVWIDLFAPSQGERDAVSALGVTVPEPREMAEIQPSRRFRRGVDSVRVTVFLPGQEPDNARSFGPVAFLISQDRLVTVHDHRLTYFDILPEAADRLTADTAAPVSLMLAILEGITGHIADRLEAVDTDFDLLSDEVFGAPALSAPALKEYLQRAGKMGQRLTAMRHCLLTVERGLTFLQADDGAHFALPQGQLDALMRDLNALAAHCDYLSSRATALTDATLGLIDLAQNRSVSVLSAVTALFVPPTFIASLYGMNFQNIPELHSPRGFAVVLGIMVVSVIGTFIFLRWRRLL